MTDFTKALNLHTPSKSQYYRDVKALVEPSVKKMYDDQKKYTEDYLSSNYQVSQLFFCGI